MPGIFYHLACAKVLQRDGEAMREMLGDWSLFLAGNVIPDLGQTKYLSHYQTETYGGWLAPNLELAAKDLDFSWQQANTWRRGKEPLKLGVMCHLTLDWVFIKQFLAEKYVLEGDIVYEVNGEREWAVKKFLSKEGLYGAYSGSNVRMVKRYDLIETLAEVPEVLPEVGTSALDNRKDEDWRKEAEGYLEGFTEYSPEILNYWEMQEAVWEGAKAVKRALLFGDMNIRESG